MGKDHYKAAFDGTDEIGLAVTATTLSIVVVFVPIAFMGGIAGQWFKPFGLTIVCSVLVSLFVSFSLDPMLSAYWPDPHLPLERRPLISRLLGRFNHWFDRQAERYKTRDRVGARPSLRDGGSGDRDLRRRAGASGDGDRRRRLRAGDGQLGVCRRHRDASRLEPRLHRVEGPGSRRGSRACGLRSCTSTRRSADKGDAVDEGRVFVKLKPKTERTRTQAEVVADIRSDLVRLGGITSSISTGFNPGEKQIQLQVQGAGRDGADAAGASGGDGDAQGSRRR